jgi:glycosyltransferase involved in cell wall biosynthesis
VSPRVLIDATAVPADRGGIGRYVDGLVTALDQLKADLVVACQRADAERYRHLAPHAEVVAGPAAISHRAARMAWEQAGLPQLAEAERVDVIHSPDQTMPLRTAAPVVVTVHDVTFLSNPELYSAVRGSLQRSAIKASLRRAARCLVPSQATRDELVRLLGADPSGIDVAYHGVDTTVFTPPSDAERQRVAGRLGLLDRDAAGTAPQSYVAFLGELSRRKNVPNLVRGFVQACAELTDPPALVLAGSDDWDDDVDRAIAEVPASLRVVRPGYLRYRDLPGYLGGARVVAVPSEAEGFGLPVLEAMACGAPVLTTPRLSLPEVGGDAVAYTEPTASAIGDALLALLGDPARRGELAKAGQERARRFTWEASARIHLECYERAVSSGN